MTANELNAWIDHGGGQELWNELTQDFNLISFQSANTGVQMGGWFNKEIKKIEDLNGLKIRMPGLGGEVLRKVGAAAVAIPGGEIFPSLKLYDNFLSTLRFLRLLKDLLILLSLIKLFIFKCFNRIQFSCL